MRTFDEWWAVVEKNLIADGKNDELTLAALKVVANGAWAACEQQFRTLWQPIETAPFVDDGEVHYEGEVEFARALLARYGTTVSCQIYGHPLQTCGECNHEKSLPVTQKGDMRHKDGKVWVCTDPDIDRWVCTDDRGWQLVPKEPDYIMKAAARNAPIPAVLLDSISARADLENTTRYKAMLEAAPKFGEEE